MEIIIQKKVSKKNNKEYYSAGVDLGYTFKVLCFGLRDCAILCNMSERDLVEELADGGCIKL